MIDAKQKIKGITNMRNFAKGVGVLAACVCFLVAIFSLITFPDEAGLKLPYYFGAGVCILFMTISICLLADIAYELVIRRRPKE